MLRFAPALALFAVACAAAPQPPEGVFAVDGAKAVLRPKDAADAARIEAEARFLAKEYGFEHGRSLRVLRDLRDLLDRPALVASLHRPEVVAFGRTLRSATGWGLDPGDAALVVAAAGGPPGEALADPAVRALLARLRAGDLLVEDAGEDLLGLDAAGAAALRAFAARTDAATRIEALAARFPFAFSPRDAAALAADAAPEFTAAEAAFLTRLLTALDLRARAVYFRELRILLDHADTTEDLLAAARAAGIRTAGAGAVLALSRIVTEAPGPLEAGDRDRLRALARRVPWPDATDLRYLVQLARDPRVPAVVDELSDRFGYRLDARDGPALIRLTDAGVPEPALPDWIRRERVPLTHPEDLLGPEQARAFADANDLRFMDALARARPELVAADRPWLERRIRDRIHPFPVRYRTAAAYPETTDDLGRFLRPDLLKAFLLLDALDRPEVVARLAGLVAQDLADPGSEVGGWLLLGPDGTLSFEVFEGARVDRNDRLHLPPRPEETVLEFHLHATDEDDAAFAGPSSGGPGTDLFRASRHRTDGLVITRLAGGAFDCDLYTSKKKVLDLGVRNPSEKVRIR